MDDYIKRKDAERLLRYDFLSALTEDERVDELNRIPSADVVEVGKAYPRAELEKYGLTEWKDKDGHSWVMVERRNDE